VRLILGILIGIGIGTIGVTNFANIVHTQVLIMKEAYQEMYDPEYRKNRMNQPAPAQPAPTQIDKVKGTMV
jgi:hypothetical protein